MAVFQFISGYFGLFQANSMGGAQKYEDRRQNEEFRQRVRGAGSERKTVETVMRSLGWSVTRLKPGANGQVLIISCGAGMHQLTRELQQKCKNEGARNEKCGSIWWKRLVGICLWLEFKRLSQVCDFSPVARFFHHFSPVFHPLFQP
jgi:hypothetical protein